MKAGINYNKAIAAIEKKLEGDGASSEETSVLAQALKTIQAFIKEQATQRMGKFVAGKKEPSFAERLQTLVDHDRHVKIDGRFRKKIVKLAEILDANNLTVAGQNVTGIDLHGVDCEGVDFSGSNLSNANMRKAKIAGALFDKNTIFNATTRLGDVHGADKAMGLFECLEANSRRYFVKRDNAEAMALYNRLKPRPTRKATPISAPSPAAENAAVPDDNQPVPPQLPTNGAAVAAPGERVNFYQLRRTLTKKKRANQTKEVRGHGSGLLETEASAQYSNLIELPVVNEADEIVGDIIRTGQNRRASQLQHADAVAAETQGTGVLIDGSAFDWNFGKLEAENKPVPASSVPVDAKFGAELEVVLESVMETVGHLVAEHPERSTLIQQKVHQALKGAIGGNVVVDRGRRTNRPGR